MSTSDLTTIAADARARLRDFAVFFDATIVASTGQTLFKLPHPNVVSSNLTVRRTDIDPSVPLVLSTDYTVDERNGVLVLASAVAAPGAVFFVQGYYYEWITDADMLRYASIAFNEITYNLPEDVSLSTLDEVVYDVIVLGCIVEALYALLTEYSRDIDVHQPEGASLPVSQRYRMVSELLQMWVAKFKHKAAQLNLGIDKIEVFTLRRVSRTTNRLVPIYRPQEFDDTEWPVRVVPPVDAGVIPIEDGDIR